MKTSKYHDVLTTDAEREGIEFIWDHKGRWCYTAIARRHHGGPVEFFHGDSYEETGAAAAAYCDRRNDEAAFCPKCPGMPRVFGVYRICPHCPWIATVGDYAIRNGCWVNEHDAAVDFQPEPDDGINPATTAIILDALKTAAASCDCNRCWTNRAIKVASQSVLDDWTLGYHHSTVGLTMQMESDEYAAGYGTGRDQG